MERVYGVGINDNTYSGMNLDGSIKREYSLWKNILQRCYSSKYSSKAYNPYANCQVSENFKSYAYFYKWCQSQQAFYEEGWVIDKDLLSPREGKLYSENTCVFVPVEISNFFRRGQPRKDGLPNGVNFRKASCEYFVRICFRGKIFIEEFYQTKSEALYAHKTAKEKICKILAEKWKKRLSKEAYIAMMNWEWEDFTF